MLNSIVRFRNSKFTKCKFNKLKLYNNPKSQSSREEGYVDSGVFKIPILIQDPSSAYSMIPKGYCDTGKTIKVYNKKLYDKYKLYYHNQIINKGNIYDETIYYVDFYNSVLKTCIFENTKFNFTNFIETEIIGAKFMSIDFGSTIYKDCKITNSKFLKCYFIHPPSEFNNILFKNIIFRNTSFNWTKFNKGCEFIDCTFDAVRFFEIEFNNIIFKNALFRNTSFDSPRTKNKKCEFIDCIFDTVEINMCAFDNTVFKNIVFRRNTIFNWQSFMDCQFIGCTFDTVTFDRCYIKSRFKACTFINIIITPISKTDTQQTNLFQFCDSECVFINSDSVYIDNFNNYKSSVRLIFFFTILASSSINI